MKVFFKASGNLVDVEPLIVERDGERIQLRTADAQHVLVDMSNGDAWRIGTELVRQAERRKI